MQNAKAVLQVVRHEVNLFVAVLQPFLQKPPSSVCTTLLDLLQVPTCTAK
jgi:hypothetical protein